MAPRRNSICRRGSPAWRAGTRRVPADFTNRTGRRGCVPSHVPGAGPQGPRVPIAEVDRQLALWRRSPHSNEEPRARRPSPASGESGAHAARTGGKAAILIARNLRAPGRRAFAPAGQVSPAAPLVLHGESHARPGGGATRLVAAHAVPPSRTRVGGSAP